MCSACRKKRTKEARLVEATAKDVIDATPASDATGRRSTSQIEPTGSDQQSDIALTLEDHTGLAANSTRGTSSSASLHQNNDTSIHRKLFTTQKSDSAAAKRSRDPPDTLLSQEVPSQPNNQTGGLVLEFASGRRVCTSAAALARAKNLLGDDGNDDTPLRGAAAKSDTAPSTISPPSLGDRTPAPAAAPPGDGGLVFEFASGRQARPSTAALARAKQLLGDDDDDGEVVGQASPAPDPRGGREVQRQVAPPDAASRSGLVLEFASGRRAQPSTAALARAKQLLGDDDDDDSPRTGPSDGEEAAPASASLFATGGGKQVRDVSGTALAAASALVGAQAEASLTASSTTSSDSGSTGSSQTPPPPPAPTSKSRPSTTPAAQSAPGASGFRRPGLRTPLHQNLAAKAAPIAMSTGPRSTGRASFKAPKALLLSPTARLPAGTGPAPGAATTAGAVGTNDSAPAAAAAAVRFVGLPPWMEESVDSWPLGHAEVMSGSIAAAAPFDMAGLEWRIAADVDHRIASAFWPSSARNEDPLTVGNFRSALLSLGVSELWATDIAVANALRWTEWTLCCAAATTATPATPLRCLAHLVLRYNDEYLEGRRSALRMIAEKDAVSTAPMVLRLARVANFSPTSARVELTDGFYGMMADFDGPLSQLLVRRIVVVGQKLLVASAVFNGTDAQSPLELNQQTVLSVAYNGTRPARPDAPLGFVGGAASGLEAGHEGRQPIAPVVPSRLINLQGGTVPSVRFTVVRVLPPVFLERTPSGQRMWRNSVAENRKDDEFQAAALRTFENLCATMTNEDAGRAMRERGEAERDVTATRTVLGYDGSEMIAVQVWRTVSALDDLRPGDRVRFFALLPSKYQRTRPPLKNVKLLSPVRSALMMSDTDGPAESLLGHQAIPTVDPSHQQTAPPLDELVDFDGLFVAVRQPSEEDATPSRWLLLNRDGTGAAILSMPQPNPAMTILLSAPAPWALVRIQSAVFNGFADVSGVTCALLVVCEYTQCTLSTMQKSVGDAELKRGRLVADGIDVASVPFSGVSMLPTLATEEAMPGTRALLLADPPPTTSQRASHPLYNAASSNALVQPLAPAPPPPPQIKPVQREMISTTTQTVAPPAQSVRHVFGNVRSQTLTLCITPAQRVPLLDFDSTRGTSRQLACLLRAPCAPLTPDVHATPALPFITYEVLTGKGEVCTFTDRNSLLLQCLEDPVQLSILHCTDEGYALHALRSEVFATFKCANTEHGALWARTLASSVVISDAVWGRLSKGINDANSPESPDRVEAATIASKLAELRRWNSSTVPISSVVWWLKSEWDELQAAMLNHVDGQLIKLTSASGGEVSKLFLLGKISACDLFAS